jgi:SAM-dependent methyltransferase
MPDVALGALACDPARAAGGEGHQGPVLADDGRGHHVVDCADCGFAHLSPRPDAKALAVYYRRAFYETHGASDWADKEAAEQGYWAIEHADRLATFAALIGRPTGALLDVGCGAGWLLAHAAARGWDVLGVEPSEAMAARARTRVPVVGDVFPAAEVTRRGPFDAVHVKQVLEHVAEPAPFVDAVRDVLRPGGVACIEVPNDFNRLQAAVRRTLAKPPWWVVHPVHVNYFDFAALERLLAARGLEPLEREATFPMEWFLLAGTDYVGRDDVGRACHARRMALEMRLEAAGLGDLRRSFRRWLGAEGIGREAVVWARRPLVS